MTTVATLQADKSLIESAISTFERERAQLFRPDGEPVFAPVEQAERTADLLGPVLDRFNDLDAHLSEADSEAGRLESIANGSDPLSALSADDLGRAASLQTLLAGEVERMPLVTLATRLQAVALGTDKPAKVVLYRLGTARHVQARELMRSGASSLAGPGRDPTREANAMGIVAGLLETIGRQITDPAGVKAGKDAGDLRKMVADLRRWSIGKRNDVTGQTERFRQSYEVWARAQF